MSRRKKPVKWKYPSKRLLLAPSPYDTPEYQEHLDAIEAYGDEDPEEDG